MVMVRGFFYGSGRESLGTSVFSYRAGRKKKTTAFRLSRRARFEVVWSGRILALACKLLTYFKNAASKLVLEIKRNPHSTMSSEPHPIRSQVRFLRVPRLLSLSSLRCRSSRTVRHPSPADSRRDSLAADKVTSHVTSEYAFSSSFSTNMK